MSRLLLVFLVVVAVNATPPPQCTTKTVEGSSNPKYIFRYPTLYIRSGEKTAIQKLYCKSKSLNFHLTTACDWSAPPLVTLTKRNKFVLITRQDSTDLNFGVAEVYTTQYCEHDLNNWSGLYNGNSTEVLPEVTLLANVPVDK